MTIAEVTSTVGDSSSSTVDERKILIRAHSEESTASVLNTHNTKSLVSSSVNALNFFCSCPCAVVSTLDGG